ncbi:hypothetical protein [Nonomuraea rubra]|uniref:Amidohydrolase n=1 Tax=Nonomuraea rubra TaxID=46180 RepID=A0A7X0NLM2_9ACTN|nr:hypothetical protein [Nonomuraea rubra]MBB6545739.1 hypothetical protein [Nonomuraea rubra]
MYDKDGNRYFVVDGHVHFWDGRPSNQANRYGTGFINCFYDYHRNLSPEATEVKRKILGLNLARLYDIPVPA